MAFGPTFANSLLLLIFQATTIADIAENDTTGPLATLYIGLHTGDPASDNQTANEADYTGYGTRPGATRDATGWDVTANEASNDDEILFPACTAGSNTITHAHVGKAATSTGLILFDGALTASRAVSAGITPRFIANALDITLGTT
jgi:hypothetical protein